MAFFDITALRMLLTTETDANSPGSEELMAQIRENIEALLILYAKAASGTLTSDPPNDMTGWAIDTGAGFTDDQHNGRTLLMTSGNAIGNFYTIDDTEAANNRVECAGDNLYADGVRSGDTYLIFYDLTHDGAHDHDGINSAAIDLHHLLPIACSVDGDEVTQPPPTATSWIMKYRFSFYTPPEGMTDLILRARLKCNDAGENGEARLYINETAGNAAAVTGTTYDWDDATFDVSAAGLAVSTWYEAEVQIRSTDDAVTAYLMEWLVFWS